MIKESEKCKDISNKHIKMHKQAQCPLQHLISSHYNHPYVNSCRRYLRKSGFQPLLGLINFNQQNGIQLGACTFECQETLWNTFSFSKIKIAGCSTSEFLTCHAGIMLTAARVRPLEKKIENNVIFWLVFALLCLQC